MYPVTHITTILLLLQNHSKNGEKIPKFYLAEKNNLIFHREKNTENQSNCDATTEQ